MQYCTPRTFAVTKKFISGWLKDMVCTQVTTVEFVVGKTYEPCAGSSKYIVLSCEELGKV